MAEKQFIVKKKKVFPKVELHKTEPQAEEVQEPLQETQEESECFSFDNYIASLKEKVDNAKKPETGDDYQNKFLFGKYESVDFAVVTRNYPDYIVFLFSKKMGAKMEHDKQRYRSWVEQRANRNK